MTGTGVGLVDMTEKGLMIMVGEEGVEVRLQTNVRRHIFLLHPECYLAGVFLVNRKRRRSPSPFERDRHDPRPRYNDDYGLLICQIA